MLPRALAPRLQAQLVQVRAVWDSDVSTTMIYTHVLKVAAGGTVSLLDAMAFET